MNRREFVQFSALAPLAGMVPDFAFANATPGNKRILVLVELDGGNDGLNTLIPLTQRSLYQKYRPTLAQSKAIDIGGGVGMHTSLKGLKPYWETGEMAWIQSVGYPKPDRSHFRSKDIWETASSANHLRDDGWLSQVLPDKEKGLHGVVVGSGLGPLAGKQCRAVAMHDPVTFINQAKLVDNVDHSCSNASLAHIIDVQHQLHGAKRLLEKSARIKHLDGLFRPSDFNNDLKSVAKMIVGGADAMVYKVTLPGFDTHAAQAVAHKNQLHYLAEGLDAFSKVMKSHKLWDNVMIMTYSEFGRSVKENLSRGTDHGTSAPMLVMGGKVQGGRLYGNKPDLNQLDSEGDLRYSTDFRSVYGSVAQRWMGQKNPWSQYPQIPFV